MSSKNNLVLYEIYPRSFQDSNGDGYGDLNGIIFRLDYLKELGINAIWITPFYPSPMKDGGYDIENYCDVSPEFGTLKDFEKFIEQAHARGIKVVIDLVVNHTSDQHPWFQESRSSRDNPKRDWYIWKDKVDGKEPNNWMSVFEPTPWAWDESTGQYYFHSFLTEQPDLNWANPEVMQAVKKVIKFWIDKDVDGFRLDAANYLWKDPRFLDEPDDLTYVEGAIQPFYKKLHIYMRDQEKVFEIIDELGSFIKEHGDGFLITESYLNKKGTDAIPIYKKYYENISSGNVIPFNFELQRIPWSADSYRQFVTAYIKSLTPTELPTFVFGNHDKPRISTRFGRGQSKIAAVLLLTLPGMPVIYYGEELGMEDVHIPREMIHDTKEYTSPGFGRDPVRTPMQWDASKNAGFTKGTPWLPLENAWEERNVSNESKDVHSMLSLYRKLLKMRQEDAVIINGAYDSLDVKNNEIFAFTRSIDNDMRVILLNFTDQDQIGTLPFSDMQVVVSTNADHTIADNETQITLGPYEACVLKGSSLNRR